MDGDGKRTMVRVEQATMAVVALLVGAALAAAGAAVLLPGSVGLVVMVVTLGSVAAICLVSLLREPRQ